MKLYIMTDLHYYSRRNWKCDPYSVPRVNDQMQFRESEEILREAFDAVLADKECHTVLLTGDLTRNGEIVSHEDLIKILEEYTAKGLKILAFTSTHDYKDREDRGFGIDQCKPEYIGYATGYNEKGEPERNVPCLEREDLRALYAPYGRNDAVSVNEYTFSYTYDLDDNWRLFAMNDDFEIAKKGQLRGYPECEYEWIEKEIARAKADGKKIFFATHHPLIAPTPLFGIIGKNDLLARGREFAEKLAEYGVSVIFTGHSHVHDISFVTARNGKPVYDVSTSALCGYPPQFRKAEFSRDGTVKVETVTLTTLSRYDLKGKPLPEYCREGFFGTVEHMIRAMGSDEKTFAYFANGISIRPYTVHKFWFLIRPFGKFINNLTFGKARRLCRKECGVSKEELGDKAKEKVVPVIMKMVENLYAGNANIDPASPEYRIIMGAISIIDGLIRLFRVNLKKITGYATVAELVEPLLFNNGIDDYNATLDPETPPAPRVKLPVFHSNKAPGIVIAAVLLLVTFFPVWLVAGAVCGIVFAIKSAESKDPKYLVPEPLNPSFTEGA